MGFYRLFKLQPGGMPSPENENYDNNKKTTIKVQKYLKINWVMFWKWTQSCSENEPSHVSPFRGFEPTPCLSQIPVTSLPAAVSGENVSRLERTRLWRREVVERNIKFGHAVPKKFDGGFVWVKFPGWLSQGMKLLHIFNIGMIIMSHWKDS